MDEPLNPQLTECQFSTHKDDMSGEHGIPKGSDTPWKDYEGS